MSPNIFRRFAVDPFGYDGATMPAANPPSALNAVVLARCDCVKQAVNVVADGMATIDTVSAASPSSVVSHSPTNMPVVELTVAFTGTPGVHSVPGAVT